MSDSHYETLGVSPDATRDEIRDAYRARVGELDPETWKGDAHPSVGTAPASVNKAWNVLSDPFQKERYDSGIDDSIAGLDDVDVDGVEVDEIDDVGNGTVGGKRARGAAGARGIVRTKITPTGLPLAPTRSRINALSVDVLVILVLLFGLNFLASALFANPAIQVAINDEIVSTTEVEDRPVSEVRDEARADAVAEWEDDNPDAENDPDVEVDEVDVVPGNVTLVFQLVTLVVALLYTVVPTVRTGQTLGKRIFKSRLVSVDGARPGWAQALLHYGVPIAIAIALALLGAVVAIGMILWSIWDKHGQGINDKIAKTFVVEAS